MELHQTHLTASTVHTLRTILSTAYTNAINNAISDATPTLNEYCSRDSRTLTCPSASGDRSQVISLLRAAFVRVTLFTEITSDAKIGLEAADALASGVTPSTVAQVSHPIGSSAYLHQQQQEELPWLEGALIRTLANPPNDEPLSIATGEYAERFAEVRHEKLPWQVWGRRLDGQKRLQKKRHEEEQQPAAAEQLQSTAATEPPQEQPTASVDAPPPPTSSPRRASTSS